MIFEKFSGIHDKGEYRGHQSWKEANAHIGNKPEIKGSHIQEVQGRGMINYYCKFRSSHTRDIWYRLNVRLSKWVRWEKGLSTRAALRYLIRKYREQPGLFPHWKWGTSMRYKLYLCE
jgi:hypothetical protein